MKQYIEPYIEQDFGEIYGGNNPTHGVYARFTIALHGSNAVAISHHWSKEAAEAAVRDGQVVVEYTERTGQIVLRVPMSKKSAYVKAAKPGKLSEWCVNALDKAAGIDKA